MVLIRLLRVLAPLAVVCGALFAASCGSNSSPSASATSYPTSATDSITLSTTGGTIPLPTVAGGNSVTLNYIGAAASPFPSPFPTGGVILTANTYVTAPANSPALTAKSRAPLSKSNATVFEYVTMQFNTTMPASAFNSEMLNIGSAMPNNVPYFVEFDDITTSTPVYINTFPGSAVNNGAISFTNSGGFIAGNNFSNVTFNVNDTYLLQFYYLGTGSTPTPTPSTSPLPTPSPVVVSTTVPLNTAASYTLPVTSGGYVGTVTIPSGGAAGNSLTITGSSVLPSTIAAVGSTSADYPFYIVGLTATGSAPLASPQVSVQLPANFPMNYPIYAALCVDGTCPVSGNNVSDIATTTSNGVVTLAPGAIGGFTGVSTQQQYIVFYSSRQTPSGNSAAPVMIPAGQVQSIQLPSITSTLGSFSSTLTIGGLAANATVTASSETGLFPGTSAIVPNSQTVVYALSVIANPNVATNGYVCGSPSCTVAVVTLPAAVVTNAANAGATFYVEECTQTQCPVSQVAPNVISLGSPSGADQLTVPATFGTNITAFDPINAYYFVFYYE